MKATKEVSNCRRSKRKMGVLQPQRQQEGLTDELSCSLCGGNRIMCDKACRIHISGSGTEPSGEDSAFALTLPNEPVEWSSPRSQAMALPGIKIQSMVARLQGGCLWCMNNSRGNRGQTQVCQRRCSTRRTLVISEPRVWARSLVTSCVILYDVSKNQNTLWVKAWHRSGAGLCVCSLANP